MARKLVKRDWNQPKGGYTPFAKPSPKAQTYLACECYEAFDRVKQETFTQKCESHR